MATQLTVDLGQVIDVQHNQRVCIHGVVEEVMTLGARLLQAADDLTADDGFQVYADPAGHPFCLCWG